MKADWRRAGRVGLLALLSLAALAAWHQFAPRRTPRGQPPLVRLAARNLGDLRQAFNAARDQKRVVLLLSPT